MIYNNKKEKKVKINKVVFGCSEEYSDFWNINSMVFKKYLDIEPVCLLYGKAVNCDVSSKYGEIVEMEFIPNLPKIIQITWGKFNYVANKEPNTTWMIGDIDQLPLQRHYFIDQIAHVDENAYIHLNENGCARATGRPEGCWQKSGPATGGADLPAHYHIAKGKTFSKALNTVSQLSLQKQIEYIIEQRDSLGLRINNKSMSLESGLWCAEETLSTNLLREGLNKEIFNFSGSTVDNHLRIDRSRMLDGKYIYDKEELRSGKYIDIHCDRPFNKTEDQINDIINIAFNS